ncbi:MAG: hypothetical protein KA408_15620 [Flavobacteriales bacterium]|nr:hypothetical protein [Flavobacteriales bacterium]
MLKRINALPRIVRLLGAQVIPVLLLVYGLWSFPLATFGPERDRIPGDLGDARFNNYILEHYHAYATGRIADYWDAPFMYPYKNVIAFSDNLLGTAPLYSLFRSIGYNRESAFQFWILALFALNYTGCYVALYAWSKRAALSAGGAYIFAFGIHMLGHMEHAQVFPKFMIPIAFYFCWKWLCTGRFVHLALLAVSVVYQFYCGIYLGFTLCYGLLFLLAAYVLIEHRRLWEMKPRTWRPLVSGSVIVAVTVLFLYPLIRHSVDASFNTEPQQFSDVLNTVPSLSSYFSSHPAALSWRSLSDHPTSTVDEHSNHFHFMGAIPWLAILLVPFVLWKNRDGSQETRVVAIVSSAMLLSILFCLRIGDFTLYKLVFELPGFSALRSIDRIVHIQAFYFALIMVLVFAQFGKKQWSRILFSLAIPLLIVLENKLDMTKMRSFNKYDAQGMVDRIVRDMELQYDSTTKAIAYMPVRSVMPYEEDHVRSIELHLNSMLAGQQLGIPVVNAYTGSYPGNYMKFWVALDERTLNDWCVSNGIGMETINRVNNLRRPVLGEDTVHLQGLHERYVCLNTINKDLAIMDRTEVGPWGLFLRIRVAPDHYAFLAHNGNFLSAALHHDSVLVASHHELGDMGIFEQKNISDSTFVLIADNGAYVAHDTRTNKLYANADSLTEHCIFRSRP